VWSTKNEGVELLWGQVITRQGKGVGGRGEKNERRGSGLAFLKWSELAEKPHQPQKLLARPGIIQNQKKRGRVRRRKEHKKQFSDGGEKR